MLLFVLSPCCLCFRLSLYFVSHRGAILSDLRPVWGAIWASLDNLGPILGRSWGDLGATLGHLGTFWGPSCAQFGLFWTVLGHLGLILGDLGAVLARLGAIWNHRQPMFGPYWGDFGPPWGQHGPSCVILAPSWGRVGAILGSSWPAFGLSSSELRTSPGYFGRHLGPVGGYPGRVRLRSPCGYMQHSTRFVHIGLTPKPTHTYTHTAIVGTLRLRHRLRHWTASAGFAKR